MGSPSKEKILLELILENSPLKEWHFKDFVKETGTTRAVVNKWLKKYVNEGLLKRNKPPGKFPFFSVGEQNQIYYSLKKTYALTLIHESGLLPALLSSAKAKTIILFGSFNKGDWYKDSDIDIFILGDVSGLDRKYYEKLLKRNIELHIFHNKNELKAVKTGLLQNVINGQVLKGRIQDVVDVS
ncbi:MAG: nucleotidyltransferase domain-containing protein [Candidatus Nanoarchaeia archaeon]